MALSFPGGAVFSLTEKESPMCNKQMKLMKSLVEEITPNYELRKTNGGHIAIIVINGNQRRTIITSSTPSDHRSYLNVRANVRRAFRSLGRP